MGSSHILSCPTVISLKHSDHPLAYRGKFCILSSNDGLSDAGAAAILSRDHGRHTAMSFRSASGFTPPNTIISCADSRTVSCRQLQGHP